METYYYNTHRLIRHRSNVVDLTEYRRKLAALTAEGALPQVEPRLAEPPCPAPVLEVIAPESAVSEYVPTRREKLELGGTLLFCAALVLCILLFAL